VRIADRNAELELVRNVFEYQSGEMVLVRTESLGTEWAARRTVGAREYVEGSQAYTEERSVFVIRWRDDLKVTDRVVFEGRTFNIEGFRDVGRRRDLEIHAKAVA